MTAESKHGSTHRPPTGHLLDGISRDKQFIFRFEGSKLKEIRDPHQNPINRCICQVRADFGDGQIAYGTGWLAGPRLLVTAAHVVHRTGQVANKPISVSIIPALDGEGREPYGRVTVHSDAIHLPVNDPEVASPSDYAVIILPESQKIGWLSFNVIGDEKLGSNDLYIAGYINGKSVQFFNFGKVNDYTDSQFDYVVTTKKGMSGSPILLHDGDNYVSVGIHVADGSECGVAVRITPQVYAFIHRIEQQI